MTTLPPEYADNDGRPVQPKAAPSTILTADRPPVVKWRGSTLAIAATVIAAVLALGLVWTLRSAPVAKSTDAPANNKDAQAQGPNEVTNRFRDGYADPATLAAIQAANSLRECPPGASAPGGAGNMAQVSGLGQTAAAQAPGTVSIACTPVGAAGGPGQGVQQSAQAAQPTPAQQAAEQRRQLALQQYQAATSSSPFFGGGGGGARALSGQPGEGSAQPAPAPLPSGLQSSGPSASAVADVGVQNGQGEKRQFAERSQAQDYLASAYLPPLSPYEVKAGAVIPAALVTALNSDLPGEVIAQVTENVYDHKMGRYVLIPQGSRLIGQYDSEIAYGQARALLAWNRIIMPNGYSINIGSMTGTDLSGASGLHDRVDAHFRQVVRGIALSTVVTIAGASAQNQQARSSGSVVLNDTVAGLSTSANQATQQFVTRDLNRQSTIKVRPGWPLRVLVNKDIVLAPYQG